MASDDDILFMRKNRFGEELAELRCNSPRVLLDVIDSVAISETRSSGKMVSRTDIVNRVLSEYVNNKIDEAILINTVLNSNPTVAE